MDINTRAFRQKVGERIKKERESTGLIQKDFAKAVGLSNQTYNNLENGIGSLKIEHLQKIANYCGCDLGYLLGDIDNRTYITTDICSATGLSEDAIHRLTSKENPNYMISIYEKKNNSNLKTELVDFLINDFQYTNGIMQTLLYFKYEKALVDEWKNSKWFSVISEIVKSSYNKNKYKESTSMFQSRHLVIGDLINDDLYKTLKDKYCEEYKNIYKETEEWLSLYIDWIIFSDINKATIQNLIMKYLEKFIFEV